jgi:glyoxylase-like metal-dependent hydrolase (beta-lactamase superfamily II)
MKGLRAGIIPCGKGTLDSNFIISFDTVLTWANPDVKPRWFTVPFMMVIIKHPEAGWILWDMGSRVDSAESWPKHITALLKYEGTEEHRIERQLAKLGLKPEDISYVILSHLHMDHSGNIHTFKDTAEFFVSKAEMKHASALVMNSTDPASYGWYIKEDVLCPVKKYHYIERDTEIFPGITLITLAGHTPGGLGCILELESGTKILTGDSVYVEQTFNGVLPGILEDTTAYHESIRKIKDYQKEYGAEIWFAHDPKQYEAWEKVPHLY